jgi:hypothetical protein
MSSREGGWGGQEVGEKNLSADDTTLFKVKNMNCSGINACPGSVHYAEAVREKT